LRRRAEPVAAAATIVPPPPPAPREDHAFNGKGATATAEASEEPAIDFANASLYLTGIQVIFATVCCACVSVLAVWLVPAANVAAVRTLVLCTMTGVLLMRTPLRVGRARGVNVVFTTLQPAVALYLLSLTVDQLLHTCTAELGYAPSWRRVIFHACMLLMLVSGLMRARAPMEETDLPFLLSMGALAVIALAPPPAVAFVGPLCQSVSLWEAADRVLRAFVFSALYSIHVYASTPSSTVAASETLIIVTRSSAAVLWVMGAHPVLLVGAVAQGAMVILARLRIEAAKAEAAPGGEKRGASTSSALSSLSPAARGGMGFASACAAVRGALGASRDGGDYSPLPAEEEQDVELGRPHGVDAEVDDVSPQARAVAAHATHYAPRAPSPPLPPLPPPLPPEEPYEEAGYGDPDADAFPSSAPPEHGVPDGAGAEPRAHAHAAIGPLAFREVGGSGSGAAAPAMTAERMAAIAASMAD